MSILWRSWLTFSVVIATVLVLLTLLATLQFNAVYSKLIRERLAVVAQTTAASFRPVVEMGLPVSMMRNARQLLERARKTDPRIHAVHVFNTATGIIVHSTASDHPRTISKELLAAQNSKKAASWSTEFGGVLNSGATIADKQGKAVGGVVIVYPGTELRAASWAMLDSLGRISIILFAVFSALSVLIVAIRLSSAVSVFARIQAMLHRLSGETVTEEGEATTSNRSNGRLGLLQNSVLALDSLLQEASRQYSRARDAMSGSAQMQAQSWADGPTHTPAPRSESSIARLIAGRIVPWAALVILGTAICLGIFAVREVNRAAEPEISSRVQLIGSIVRTNVQRAVDVGIPIHDLVGGQQYLGHVLQDFPELTYVGLRTTTGQVVFESGKPPRSTGTGKEDQATGLVFPVEQSGQQVGEIRLATDPGFIESRFRGVLLDFVVVVLVATLLAFEAMTRLLSASLTAPFEHLQRLITEQASGRFSSAAKLSGRTPVHDLSRFLSARADELHASYKSLLAKLQTNDRSLARRSIGDRYGLNEDGPKPISLRFVNDIRLPLFIFVAAEELATPFLPMFARSTSNPWPWLDQGVVIALPIIGYLVAIVLFSPFARRWANRLGHRKLFLLALIPAVIDNLGLYFATTVPEVVVWRSLTGVGYALVTLACQDYILDIVSTDRRSRALGVFVSVVIAGTFCGTALGGVLADRLGPRTVFLIGAGLVLVAGWLAYQFLVANSAQPARPATNGAARTRDVFRTLTNLRFCALVFGVAIPANILLAGILWYVVPLAMDAAGRSTADIGRTMMLYYLIILVAGPMFVHFADERIGPAGMSALGAAISGLSLLLPFAWPSLASIVLAVTGAGLGHAMIRAPSVAVALKLAEGELRQAGPDIVLGSLRTLERAGCIVGLIVVAAYANAAGYDRAMAATGVLILVGNFVFLFAMREGMTERAV